MKPQATFQFDLDETFPHLENAPIAEAVVQWEARPSTTLVLEELGQQVPAGIVPSEFSKTLVPEGVGQLLVEQLPDYSDCQGRYRHRDNWLECRCTSADKLHVFQFNREGLHFSRLKPYATWEAFTAEAMRVWQLFAAIAQPAEIGRLAVRFTNRIAPIAVDDLPTYLKHVPTTLDSLGLPISSFLWQSQHDVPGHPFHIIVIQAIKIWGPQGDEPGPILYTEVSSTQPLAPTAELMQDHLAKMRWLKNKVFFSLLKTSAVKMFQGEGSRARSWTVPIAAALATAGVKPRATFRFDLDETFPHLWNAPIAEAVIQWQAWNSRTLVPEELGQQLAAQLPDFPDCQAEYVGQDIWLGFRGTSADKLHVFQFNDGGVVFSRLKPYATWEAFAAEAMRLWQVFAAIAQPAKIERLAVRFTNRIAPIANSDLATYLKQVPTTLDSIGLPISSFCWHSSHPVPGHPFHVNVLQAIQPSKGPQGNEPGLVLDIDVSSTRPLAPTAELVEDHLAKMRWLKNKVFFSLLKTSAVKLFQGENDDYDQRCEDPSDGR